MIHLFMVISVLFALILILYISVVLGRWFGRRQLIQHPAQKLEVMEVAEASVFALLGLLIAFTFSGAYDRYESRKLHILEQANAYNVVYNYLDFLPASNHAVLHGLISQYLDLNLSAYHHQPFTKMVQQSLDRALEVEDKIWHHAVHASADIKNSSIASSFIQAVNAMFDTSHTVMNLSRIHPPAIIFVLMLCLAALGGFLIGYDAAESKQPRHIHTVSYVLLTAITIYVIMNLEYPRTGFIRLNSFDHILLDARDHNNKSLSSLLLVN